MNLILAFADTYEDGTTHWTAVIVHKNKNYYFDSYGADTPDSVRHLLGSNIVRSTYVIQNYDTYSSGEFSMLMIFLLVVRNMQYFDIVFL